MGGAIHLAVSRRVLFVTGAVVLALAGLAIAASEPAGIRLGTTSFGRHVAQRLQNANHYAIYISTHDLRDKSRCSGQCTLTFKPVIAHGRVEVGWRKEKLLGTINRGDDVKQVTYNHHPLYTSTDDSSPGVAVDDDCSVAGGRWGFWFVIDRNGNPDKRFSPCLKGY